MFGPNWTAEESMKDLVEMILGNVTQLPTGEYQLLLTEQDLKDIEDITAKEDW